MTARTLIEAESEPQFVHPNGVRLWWDMDDPDSRSLTALAPPVPHKFDYDETNKDQEWENAEDAAETAMQECPALKALEAQLGHPEWTREQDPVKQGELWLLRYYAHGDTSPPPDQDEETLAAQAELDEWEAAMVARGITPFDD